MKKRLKNLLALCMVAMMMFAMSTGVVSAETYYASMTDGGVSQYRVDKDHGNDPKTLYKGIPDNGTIAMNPGDIIVPVELTGADKDAQGGKYGDFCGKPFFIVKSVEGKNLDATYVATLDGALSSNYKTAYKEGSGYKSLVYRYDSSWDSYKTTLELSLDKKVKIKKVNGEYDDVLIQEWQVPEGNDAARMTNELGKLKFYESAYYDEFGYVQWIPSRSIDENELLKRNDNKTVNAFMRLNIKNETNSNETICSALKLPDCDSGYGYHYNVSKISAEEWGDEYGPKYSDGFLNEDNVPTGIKPLAIPNEEAPNGKSPDYTTLVDTIFGYRQDKADTSKYFYETQVNTGLEIVEEANTYTINFDANGGEGTMNSISNKTYNAADNKLPKNDFTRTGYTFAGWKIKKATYPDPIDASLDPIEVDTTKDPYKDLYEDEAEYIPGNHNETVTLEAQWEENSNYTVKYNTNSSDTINDKTGVKWTDKVLAGIKNIFKTGYTFEKWTCDGIVVSEEMTYGYLAVKDIVASITLDAQWKANDYTVKFDTDGGSDIADKTVKWADKVLADVEDPTKDGFTFKGWKCGEAEVTADTTYAALAEDDAIEELTLKAQWEEIVVPADEPDDTSSTGDNMNITLLMALLLLSGCGIAGAGLYRRNHVK